jgi:DHA2 family multidrug resistance protein
MTVVGMLLYTTMFIAPQFLVAVVGYNASQAGQVVFIAGIVSIPAAFVYPLLVTRVDTRILVGAAILILGFSNLMVSSLTADSTGEAFTVAQVLFGIGTTLSSMPIMQSSMNAVHLDDVAESNSLMSVARNLGGAVGLAAIASFQEQRFELHRWNITGAMPANDGEVQRQLADASAMFGGGPDGLAAAYHAMDGQVSVQAMVMMFNDLYLVLGVIALLFVPSVLFLRPSPPGSAPMAMH